MTDGGPARGSDAPRSILVCINRRYGNDASCASRGSVPIADALEDGIRRRRIDVGFERSVCLGRCLLGPTVRFVPGGRFNLQTRLEDVAAILDELERLCGVIDDGDAPPVHLLGS